MAKKKPTPPPWVGAAAPPPSTGTGVNGARGAAGGGRPVDPAERLAAELGGSDIVQRRHADWFEHQIRWRWLLDSYEGGQRYRNATYGPDRKGLPTRNLFRHKNEYPDPQQFPNLYQGFAGFPGGGPSAPDVSMTGPFPGMLGADASATAQDDDFEYRRSRTPPPEFVAQAVGKHLGKIYSREVSRKGPDDLVAWWSDVDNRGTPVDDWMRETVAPLLLVLGCLDICLDHPEAPPGATVATRADELRLGLDRCVASYILPENMLWWRLDHAGRYVECLVREYVDPSERADFTDDGRPIDPDDPATVGVTWRENYVRYRWWTRAESILFSYDGTRVIERKPHQFGAVPIVRLVDQPRHRSPHLGKSRYDAIAEYQREFYNRDSELILSDTIQAHPCLSGAEDFCKADNTVAVGPGRILPKKKVSEGGAYVGWEYVSPSKDPAESIRKNKQDIIELKDGHAGLLKPAGASGGRVTAQSGVSKALDHHEAHPILCEIARSLARNERRIAEYALLVIRDQLPDPASRAQINVTYSQKFALMDVEQLSDAATKIQAIIAGAGAATMVETELVQELVHLVLPGYSDGDYDALDAEIASAIEAKATIKEQFREMLPGFTSRKESLVGTGSEEQDAGTDPVGESAATMVSGIIPSVT